MENKTKKTILKLFFLSIIIIILALIFGTVFINPFTDLNDSINRQIFYEIRLPRVIAAIISGMTLGASGLLIQNSLQNQLADSTILGFQSGSTLVALIIMLIFPFLYPFLPLLAFFGGLLVYMIIFIISYKTPGAIYLIVAGIAVSAVIRSFINLISQLFAQNLENTISWTNGSLSTVNQTSALYMIIYGIFLLLITLYLTPKLDLLLLDDDYLTNLGINTFKIRILTTSLAIMLTAASVSFVGTIGFVGLLAPHISRRLVANSSINLMPTTILVGGLLVLGCDTLQRFIFPIYEIPVGIILSLIGGVYLIYLLIRSKDVSF